MICLQNTSLFDIIQFWDNVKHIRRPNVKIGGVNTWLVSPV